MGGPLPRPRGRRVDGGGATGSARPASSPPGPANLGVYPPHSGGRAFRVPRRPPARPDVERNSEPGGRRLSGLPARPVTRANAIQKLEWFTSQQEVHLVIQGQALLS